MYGFTTTLTGLSFDEALAKATAALKAEGFGVLSDVDIQRAMKEKLGTDMPPYRILGACAPGLAKRVIESDRDAGSMLPCGVAAMAVDANTTRFAFQDPEMMSSITDNPTMKAVALEAKAMLMRVRDRLSQ